MTGALAPRSVAGSHSHTIGLHPWKETTVFAANRYFIRLATDDDHEDAAILARLAELDGRGPLQGPALIGYLNGQPAAAIAVADSQTVADPRCRTDDLVAYLRIRASALHAYQLTPSLRMRMLAAVSVTDQHSGAQAAQPPEQQADSTKRTGKTHRRWRPARRRAPSVA
jgi:hypothetical protein